MCCLVELGYKRVVYWSWYWRWLGCHGWGWVGSVVFVVVWSGRVRVERVILIWCWFEGNKGGDIGLIPGWGRVVWASVVSEGP